MTAPDPRVFQLVVNAAKRKPTAGAAGHTCDNITTTSHPRVEVVQSGGVGLSQVKRPIGSPHIESLTQHMRGLLGVPGAGRSETVGVCC